MAEIKSKQIGQFVYTCQPLTGKKTIKVFVRLCNVLGPVVKGIDVAALAQESEEAAIGAIMGGVSEALVSLKDEDLEYLTDMFAANCLVTLEPGKNPTVAQLGEQWWGFKVPFGDWLAWLMFCIQTNYADFLGEKGGTLMGALGLRRKATSTSSSQPVSTGTAGDSS